MGQQAHATANFSRNGRPEGQPRADARRKEKASSRPRRSAGTAWNADLQVGTAGRSPANGASPINLKRGQARERRCSHRHRGPQGRETCRTYLRQRRGAARTPIPLLRHVPRADPARATCSPAGPATATCSPPTDPARATCSPGRSGYCDMFGSSRPRQSDMFPGRSGYCDMFASNRSRYCDMFHGRSGYCDMFGSNRSRYCDMFPRQIRLLRHVRPQPDPLLRHVPRADPASATCSTPADPATATCSPGRSG